MTITLQATVEEKQKRKSDASSLGNHTQRGTRLTTLAISNRSQLISAACIRARTHIITRPRLVTTAQTEDLEDQTEGHRGVTRGGGGAECTSRTRHSGAERYMRYRPAGRLRAGQDSAGYGCIADQPALPALARGPAQQLPRWSRHLRPPPSAASRQVPRQTTLPGLQTPRNTPTPCD